ncbi:MAG: hypothetical protein JXR86_14035 [Spirochaetales bacterium]|nr:hypothetical protein [Spirochaetales bacterium]
MPGKTDLFLSAAIALLFPAAAGFLLTKTGALLPMLLYYGAAWCLSYLRRGKSGYELKNPDKPPLWFYINTGVIMITLIIAYAARIESTDSTIWGLLFTGLIWTTANASSKQLLWIYIFDSWDLYGREKTSRTGRYMKRGAGLLLFSFFVGMIHALYWGRFLHTVNPGGSLGILFIAATSLSGYLHIVVWRKSGNMLYTFIPHFLLNLFPLFWTGYSIVPFLIK